MSNALLQTEARRLPVHERFYSWQGEGCHAGRAAFFIRLYGCPVQCPWCDSAGTWHPEFIPRNIERLPPDELLQEAIDSAAAFVVITGGEPAIHDLSALTDVIRDRGLRCHIETSGAFPLQGTFDWVTVSPKWQKLPLRENVRCANELKLIVEHETSIADWLAWLGDDLRADHVWLHPEWSQRQNRAVLDSINQTIKERGDPFRAGYQLHKLYQVDEQDPRSRPPAPLGGRIHLSRED